MTIKKGAYILIFLCILLLLAVYIFYLKEDKAAQYPEKWGISVNLEGFSFKDFSSDEAEGITREMLDMQREDALVKITRTKTASPQKYIEDRGFLFNSMFLPTTSPYPGMITNVIECPEEFLPGMKEVESGTIYTLFAGDRFNYGVCASDMIAYFSAYGIFDCRGKGIFEVRVFSENEEEVENIINSFHCLNL